MVHRREIDGEAVVFGNQGALWGNAMTWWDHDTGSVWSQPLGEAILGPLAGEKLELLTSSVSSWADWRADHPATLALDAPGSQFGFSLDPMAIVVEFGDESVAYPIEDLRVFPVVNSEVAGVPIAVVLKPGSDSWAVFSRELDGRVVEIEWVGDGLGIVDGEGRYDPVRGLDLAGTGQALGLLPAFTSFPRDYVTFFPDGAFWTPSGLEPATGS
jgi:hypothetical protein